MGVPTAHSHHLFLDWDFPEQKLSIWIPHGYGNPPMDVMGTSQAVAGPAILALRRMRNRIADSLGAGRGGNLR